jgi:predicted nucleotidyltransferase
MQERDKRIIADFERRIPVEVKHHIKRLILFGSRATGQALEDSDLDLAALVDEKNTEIETILDDVAYNVMWDYDFRPIISLKIFSESDFKRSVERGFSFYKNVEKRGISL